MPLNASKQLRLHPDMAKIIAKYAQLDKEMDQFYEQLRAHLQTGMVAGIFPGQMNQIGGLLTEINGPARQTRQEPPVLVVSGRRALVALNSFIFDKTVLEDEAFFFDKTLFIIGNQQGPNSGQASARIQIYKKGKLSPHSEMQFDSTSKLNRQLAEELLTLHCDKGFDGISIEIGVQCPELGRIKIAATFKVDALLKELLDPIQQQAKIIPHRICLMLHFFAPHPGNEPEQKVAEAELTYVSTMAARSSHLLLLCEYRRGKLDEVAASVQKCESPAVCVCYYTQWQWDGLHTIQSQVETSLNDQLQKRSAELTKKAIKELILPLKVVHQIRRNITLSQSICNNQRRPPKEYLRDFEDLRKLSSHHGSSYRKIVDSKISDVSDAVAQHLRNGVVRARIIKNIIGRAVELKGSTEHKVEIIFLEVVAAEIREWNCSSQWLNRADEQVHQIKIEKFKELCHKANTIPEIILVSDDMLHSTENSTHTDQSSEPKASIHSFIDDMVRRRLQVGKLENFAAGIAAPLWVPLAAITMAIIAPVIGSRRETSDEKFQTELRGTAQDFLDRLDAPLIRSQFFALVRDRLFVDAKRLEKFVEQFCILPADKSLPVNPRLNDDALWQHLFDLEGHLKYLHGNLMIMQVEKLRCEVLSMEECNKLGVDMDVEDLRKIGKQLVKDKPVYEVASPNAEKPLVLKVAEKREDTHRMLLEIDILKTVSTGRHSNIIPWLGTVYFPKLQTIGFLTHKYDCDLWQFLKKYEATAIPFQHPARSPERGAAFVVCRHTCDQIFEGVHQLHAKQILHRDLKLENVLVEVQRNTEPLRITIKLCDFGMAKHESEMSGNTYGGTNGYRAPELLQAKPQFSNKSDIYALGIIAWECYFGQRVREREGALQELKSGDNGMWDWLVKEMTAQNPIDRMLIEQCRMILREFDKKQDDGWKQAEAWLSPTLPHQQRTVPSLRDSLLALTVTKGSK